MAKDKVDERLKNISQDELSSAQKKLDFLCAEHNLKSWKVDAGKADWRELCYRIIGLPYDNQEPKKIGRKGTIDQETFDYIVSYIDLIDDFSNIDKDGNETYEKMSLGEKYDLLLKSIAIHDSKTEYSGKSYNAKDTLDNLWKNKGRKRLKELEEERKKAQQEEEDWSDMPDEFYKNFYLNNPPIKKKKE